MMKRLYVRALCALAVCGVMGVSSVAAAQEHEIRLHTCQASSGGVTVYINGGTKATVAAKRHKVGEVKQLVGGWSGKVVQVGEFTSKVLIADKGARCVNQSLAPKPSPTPAPTPAPVEQPAPVKARSNAEICEDLRAEKVAQGWHVAKLGTQAAKGCDGNKSRQEINIVQTSGKNMTVKHRCGYVTCDPSLRSH